MITSDRAITNDKDARLNRVNFADHLSDLIINWNNEESIVLALYGAWGSGKSLVVNLIVNQINNKTESWGVKEKPILVWFNPWNISDKNQMLQTYFQ